jgi:benzoyl-CoA reductase/2-hydroxyglutaryl-CoA dehydratase subunit BcrC/BadD/HgdB
MIAFLEYHTGRKMDLKKLSQSSTPTNQSSIFYRQNLRVGARQNRHHFPSLGTLELISADYLFPGQPEAINYLTVLKDELKPAVSAGKGEGAPERFRLMTLFIPPMHLLGSLGHFFSQHGAVSVAEPLFTRWSEGRLDPSRPLESVARKSFLMPERRSMYGPLSGPALTDIIESAQQYQVDGAVYWAFIGCRHTCATIKIIRRNWPK